MRCCFFVRLFVWVFSEINSGVFFHGNRNSTEKVFFSVFPDTSRNNSIWYMLGGKIPFFVSQKMPVNCKALFPRWKLKICKSYGVSNIEELFPFAAHCFLEDLLVAASDYYQNHIFQEWNFDEQKILSISEERRKIHATAFYCLFIWTLFVCHFY